MKNHDCRVILIRSKATQKNDSNNNNNINGDINKTNSLYKRNLAVNGNFKQLEDRFKSDNRPPKVLSIYCNLLDIDQLGQCAEMTHKLYGEIDILIENKLNANDAVKATDCIHFINSTSDNIRSTINVCIIFVLFIVFQISC